MGSEVLLEIKDLSVEFTAHQRKIPAVRGVDLTLLPGQFHAIVGESGAGKTVTSLSILRLLPANLSSLRGTILFKEHNLLELSEEVMRDLRGREISMIFQEPAKYLNPSLRVGFQVMEAIRYHLGYSEKAARERVCELFEKVGLSDPEIAIRRYPHEFSVGMKQRVMIAMAISCNPSLLIADEPTTSLDVGVQRQIMHLLLGLQESFHMAILYITHDLGIVRYAADVISIMYAGKIIETAPKEILFASPMHPYTRLLLSSIPSREKRGTRLQGIPGTVPNPENIPEGCAFHPRCPLAQKKCTESIPPLVRVAASHRCACYFPGKEFGTSL
ncbi:MAG: ABC transporter ATP-binding protein [Spirochaetales bacterium]